MVWTVLSDVMDRYMEWDMGEGLDSPHVSHDEMDSGDGVYGVGHSDGMDSGDGVYGVGQSPCVPWYIQTGRTVGMGYMEWDMGEGLDSPHVSHGTFRRDGQWGWGIWSGTWKKVWTVPMCPMVVGVGHGGCPHVSHGT